MFAALILATSAMTTPTPQIIAHRGASGYLPEHTLQAYAMAYGQGADVIEPDLVLTKDDVLLCSHDLTLERTTNVEEVFPDRKAADGKWYAADFRWDEIQRLTVDGPRRSNEPLWNDQIRKVRLSDMVGMIRTLNTRTGREVGIIPEPKNASFHTSRGKDLILILHRELTRLGYQNGEDGCVVQSFEEASLRRLKDLGSQLPRVFLMSSATDFDRAGGWDGIRQIAGGIGPRWTFAAANDGKLIRDARSRGLKVYPWTFDANPESVKPFLKTWRVDGVFTDFPDIAFGVRQSP